MPNGHEFDFETTAQKYGVDPDIIRRQITQESGGNPRATSPKGAMGLMQLMPDTAKELGVTDPYDPQQNLEGGMKLMGRLTKKYGGDYSKALAAYNAGEERVDKGKTLPDETQAYVQAIMGRRPPVTIQNPRSFLDVAASFPVDMSEDTYNAARSKYFQDVIVPKIKPEESVGATWKTFQAQTERPHLLTTAGRAALAAQIGATAAVNSVAAPLRAVDAMGGTSDVGHALDSMKRQETDLTHMGDREGLSTGVLRTAGSIAGQVVAFEAMGMATGGVAAEIAGNFAHSVRSVKLLASTLRGGMAFGTYDALSDTDGNRMVAGLKGFGVGATFDLVLGTPGFLMNRGAAATRGAAEDIAKRAASGIKPPPPVDGALAEKAVADAQVARAEGRPNEIKYTNQPGARVYVTDVAGNTQPIEIKQYREADTYRQVSNIVAQGGQVSHFEVNPENQKVLNEYLRMQTNIEAAKYTGTTLRTGNGQAASIASAANAAGLPAEALGTDSVHIATVTHEMPTGVGKKAMATPDAVVTAAGLQRKAYPGDMGISLITHPDHPFDPMTVKDASLTTGDALRAQMDVHLGRGGLVDAKPVGEMKVAATPEARVAPTPEEVDTHLDKQGVAPKDRNFVSRSIEKAWDENIPTSDKQREIQVALKYAPHMLPPEYSEYTLPRITSKHSYMFGQVDANAVSDKVGRVAAETLGYPVKVMDVVTGENPNRVKVFIKGDPDPAANESIKNALQGKLGPAYDIAFSAAPQGRRFDILGARSSEPRVQTDDDIEKALDFWDVKPSDVDVDSLSRMTDAQLAKELEAVKARVEDVAKGERIAENRPRVTDEGRRPPLKSAEEDIPPNERETLSLSRRGFKFGDKELPSIHAAVEEVTGNRFLDQGPLQAEATLRTRPGGRKLMVTPESMTAIGATGANAASHPDLKGVLKQLGIEPPASVGDAEPVTILKEGDTNPLHVWHEALHTNIAHAEAFNHLPVLMPPSVRGVALDLAAGLKKMYRGYADGDRVYMFNEAYVHAAQAVRFGQEKYLQTLADMDTSVDSVKDFVNGTSKNLLRYSIDEVKDSIPMRNLQRSVSDLIRRTDSNVGYEVAHGVRITGSGTDAWYDPARGWVLQETPDTQRTFEKLSDLWSHVDGNDKNFLSPSYSFMPEQAGVRGGMTPPGAEPNGSRPPNPEVPPGRRLAWSGLSAFWRPTLPWAASLDTAVNKVFRSKGVNVPIYDAFKDVDDMVRSGDRWMQDMSQKSGELLDHFDQKKLYDAAQYLTHPETERTQALMDQYKLTTEDAQRLHLYGDFLKQFNADTGIDALGFLRRDYPRLRMHAWDPAGVWGPGISEKNAGFWEKAVRYDKTLDPADLNLGRFNQFLLREGMQKKFTAEPLNKLNALINRKDAAGELLLPSNVRYPMTNYHNYMKGIPDNSQSAIQNGMGHFFDVLNERAGQLNENLPSSMQIPKITMQPKQIINRMMILSYAMGLGARPAIAVRDGLWSLISSSVFLGPGRMTRALLESFKPESWARATQAGALLATKNVGEMYGDIIGEIPSGGKNLFDRVTNWSNMLLAPSRWAHNFGRNIMFNGEYLDALDTIKDFRSGKVTADALFDNTTLAAMDKPAQNRLLRFVHDKTMSPEAVATKFGLDAVDIAEWPYRRGTQPLALRYGAGRILGQYGVWPANYIDFGARVGRLAFTNPRLASRMALMWGATNFAASSAMEHVGVDSSKWFFLSPMGYAGSPQLEFVQNAMKAPEDTQEGRTARRAVLEYPLNFVPAAAEVESILKGMKEPGGDQWPPTGRQFTRMLGFKPLDEHIQDRDWGAWLRYQTGFPKAKP